MPRPSLITASEPRPVWWLPLVFGMWAAAIALAPGLAWKALLAAPAVIAPLLWWTLRSPSRWLALFFAAALLLPPLPIPLGDSGPHLAMPLAALGLLAGVLWLAEWQVVPTGLNAAFVTLFAVLLASVAPAAIYSGGAAAAASAARVLLFGISLYVFFYAAYGPGRQADAMRSARLFYGAAPVAPLFACVDFYFQLPAPAGYGPQFVWLDSGVCRRAQGLFYEASTLGNFCAFFLAMIAAALLSPREQAPVSRRGLLLGGMVFATALVLSYSRGSLVNALVAIAVLIYLNRPRIRLGRLFLVLAGAALAGGLALRALLASSTAVFAGAYWMRVSTSVEYLFSETEGLLSGRVASWRAVLGFLALHPWHALFGVGYKTLPYSDYLGRTVITDNMYLSLLAETGIVGLGAMVWLSLQ